MPCQLTTRTLPPLLSVKSSNAGPGGWPLVGAWDVRVPGVAVLLDGTSVDGYTDELSGPEELSLPQAERPTIAAAENARRMRLRVALERTTMGTAGMLECAFIIGTSTGWEVNHGHIYQQSALIRIERSPSNLNQTVQPPLH